MDGSEYDENEEVLTQSQEPYYQRTIMKLQHKLDLKTKDNVEYQSFSKNKQQRRIRNDKRKQQKIDINHHY